MGSAVMSSYAAIELAESLTSLGFKPNDVEGNTLFFRRKVRITPDGAEYSIRRGKREPSKAKSLHEVVETLQTLGV